MQLDNAVFHFELSDSAQLILIQENRLRDNMLL